MSISLVQKTSFVPGNSSTASATFGRATSVNNLLVACLVVNSAVVPTTPSGWTQAVQASFSTQTATIYYQQNAVSANAVVVGLSGSNRWMLLAFEYTGIATSSALDQTASSTNGTGSAGSVTTTNAEEVVIALFGTGNSLASGQLGYTYTYSGGNSISPTIQGSGVNTSAQGAYVTTTLLTETATYSQKNDDYYNGVTATFSSGSVTPQQISAAIMVMNGA